MHFYPGELPRHPADRKHLRIDVHQSLVQIIGVAVDNLAQVDLSSECFRQDECIKCRQQPALLAKLIRENEADRSLTLSPKLAVTL